MAVGDLYRLAVIGKLGMGQMFVSVLHYQQMATEGGVGARELAEAFEREALDAYCAQIPSAYLVTQLEARQVTGGEEAFDLPVVAAGVGVGDPLPPQVCTLISWRTGFVGRKNHGRTYLPAPVEAAQVSGNLTSEVIGAYNDVAAALMTLEREGGAGTQFSLSVYHRDDGTFTPVQSYIVRGQLATQRRRRVGTGS